jgi:hypothetical protein
MSNQRRDFNDLDFTVIATPINEAVWRFELYEIVSRHQANGNAYEPFDVPNFPQKGGNGPGDCTPDISDAIVYATGEIKWDGCSNWLFNHDEAGWYHYCGRKQIQSLARVMEACWLWAGELISGWDGEA